MNFPPSRPDSRQLQIIRGSLPHRHAWNYPSNDLSAIYSDVVMNTQLKPDFSCSQNANLRHDCVTDDVGPQRPLDHCLPTSIPTTSSPYGYHTSTLGPCSSLRRVPASKDPSKRLSASFLLSSTSPQPTLLRSSSVDFLSNESLQRAPLREQLRRVSPSSRGAKADAGEVSMEETQEIIDNIDKLLNS